MQENFLKSDIGINNNYSYPILFHQVNLSFQQPVKMETITTILTQDICSFVSVEETKKFTNGLMLMESDADTIVLKTLEMEPERTLLDFGVTQLTGQIIPSHKKEKMSPFLTNGKWLLTFQYLNLITFKSTVSLCLMLISTIHLKLITFGSEKVS